MQFRDPMLQAPALIERIYEAALDGEKWRDALTGVADVLASDVCHLVTFEASDLSPVFGCVGRFPQEGHEEFIRDYAEVDLRTQRLLRLSNGSLSTDLALTTPEERRFCPVHNEFLPRWKVLKLMALSFETDHQRGILTLLRSRAKGDYGREQLDLLRLVGPHVVRAYELSSRLAAADTRSATFEAFVDQLDFSVLAVDEESRIVAANRRAECLLSAGDGLRSNGPRLSGLTPVDTRRLRGLVREAAEAGWNRPPSRGTLRLRKRSGGHLEVLVSPLPEARVASRRARVAVIVTDPDDSPPILSRSLQKLHGLTPSEASLAEALVRGTTLKDYADEAGIRVGTARAHLKNVMGKTGTRRQAELVRLLLAGPLRLLDSDANPGAQPRMPT